MIFCRKIEKKQRICIEIPVSLPLSREQEQFGYCEADCAFLFFQKTGVKYGGVSIVGGGEVKNNLIPAHGFQWGKRGKGAAAGQSTGRGRGRRPVIADERCGEGKGGAPLWGSRRDQPSALAAADSFGPEEDPVLIGSGLVDFTDYDPAAAFVLI